MAKKPEPFHNPFKGLKLKPAEPEKKPEPPRAPARPVTAPLPTNEGQGEGSDPEAELFRRHVGGGQKVVKGPKVVTKEPPPLDSVKIRNEEEEALEELALLVAGDGPFDISSSSERIEGHVAGLDAKLLKRLRGGDYPLQGRLDLHGLSRVEAKSQVERFVMDARRSGKRCVLLVHGRGLHSDDQIAVLKEGVQQWLSRGRLAREVLAFCSALPKDGGAGAVYVLLRR